MVFTKDKKSNSAISQPMMVLSSNISDTQKFANDFLKILSLQPKNKAILIALKGELGSGKTTFLRFLGEALGVKERITSPTFVLMHEHDISQKSIKSKVHKVKSRKFENKIQELLKKSGYKRFIHIDCYRVSEKDILDLGLEDLMADKKNIMAIEWADKIKKFLPKAIWLEFKIKSENEREIIVKIPNF